MIFDFLFCFCPILNFLSAAPLQYISEHPSCPGAFVSPWAWPTAPPAAGLSLRLGVTLKQRLPRGDYKKRRGCLFLSASLRPWGSLSHLLPKSPDWELRVCNSFIIIKIRLKTSQLEGSFKVQTQMEQKFPFRSPQPLPSTSLVRRNSLAFFKSRDKCSMDMPFHAAQDSALRRDPSGFSRMPQGPPEQEKVTLSPIGFTPQILVITLLEVHGSSLPLAVAL